MNLLADRNLPTPGLIFNKTFTFFILSYRISHVLRIFCLVIKIYLNSMDIIYTLLVLEHVQFDLLEDIVFYSLEIQLSFASNRILYLQSYSFFFLFLIWLSIVIFSYSTGCLSNRSFIFYKVFFYNSYIK